MKNTLVAVLFSLLLFGCDSMDSLKEGFKHSTAVSAALEKSLGAKSFVGFNWSNGLLQSVTVSYSEVPKNKSLQEIISETSQAVAAEFKQTPGSIVISFTVQP